MGSSSSTGERKNSNDQDLDVEYGGLSDPFFRSWRIRDCWRVKKRPSLSGAVKEESRGTIYAFGRFIISRSSFVVNAASRGPLRPMMEICSTFEVVKTSSTDFGTSYLERVHTSLRRIRATSRDTFPFPMIERWDILCNGGGGGAFGWLVYQCTIEIAGTEYSEGAKSLCKFGSVQPVANKT